MTPLFVLATGLAFAGEWGVRLSSIVTDYVPWFEWRLLLIPPITGIIGYLTNWVAIRMLFYPLGFRGVDVPGMEQLTANLPYRIRQIPGMMEGKLGWQGIIPSRARKMGSISVDTGITRIASQREFYETFDPEIIAEHIVSTSEEAIHDLVEEIVREQNPELWVNSSTLVRQLMHARISDQLPSVTRRITHRIGENVDDLLDIKMMVIEDLGENPELLNRIFLETGDREFTFLVRSGFYFGTLLGCISVPLFVFIDRWWVLPVAGVFVGYATNWLALKMIFRPMHPIDVGPFTFQGIFLSRQDEAAETYAEIVSEEILTLENIAENLLSGPNADRTRRMIKEELAEAIDRSAGLAGPIVRMTAGASQYESIRQEIADRGVDYAVEPMQDRTINERRSGAIRELMARRMKEMPAADFATMLRAAFKEDEWLLIAVGAALGFVAGWVQLLVVTAV
ncbi:DUF445 family protein [Natronomonas salina]|uniref:DUF445 family protein n=1 Tax=Natronomonas salina TaxID=1710540 RepID=UPI0015B77304|nr:DUF445 family protein [Natronomonas salina]QLD90279.1 DUF445 family protein [Natronomonas salina]